METTLIQHIKVRITFSFTNLPLTEFVVYELRYYWHETNEAEIPSLARFFFLKSGPLAPWRPAKPKPRETGQWFLYGAGPRTLFKPFAPALPQSLTVPRSNEKYLHPCPPCQHACSWGAG
jgi:hypothetical protein